MSADTAEQLRGYLKTWEIEFKKSHGGKKPSSADIKANPEIALKYKQYNKLRAPLSDIPNAKSISAVNTTPTKRRKVSNDLPLPATPSAGGKLFETPRKDKSTPVSRRVVQDDNLQSPQSAKKFLDSQRKTVGPTPQRNGVILGLFDLFSALKSQKTSDNAVDEPQATPSKTKVQLRSQTLQSPCSNSKTRPATLFATPVKGGNDGASIDASTPFKTPNFLKRTFSQVSQHLGLSTIDESGERLFGSPEVTLPKRRVAGRGLTSILAGLRKLEDDRLDEELEMMREAEMEEEGRMKARQDLGSQAPSEESIVHETQIEASAAEPANAAIEEELEFDPSMLEIPDEELSSDSEVETAQKTALNRDGQPRKIYKKKGQKRTTKRVKMKPVLNAEKSQRSAKEIIKSAAAAAAAESQDNDETSGDLEDHSQDPFLDSSSKLGAPKKKEGNSTGLKKAARKISATAHANFRRLKIKSRGSKPGGRGRFGRRR